MALWQVGTKTDLESLSEREARKKIHSCKSTQTDFKFRDQFSWSSEEGWNKDGSGESAGERSQLQAKQENSFIESTHTEFALRNIF